MTQEIRYIVRYGKKRGRGWYLNVTSPTNEAGKILYGGATINAWMPLQKRAKRFWTYEKAYEYACRMRPARVVKLRVGNFTTRLEQAEMAGRDSALSEVETALPFLAQKDPSEPEFTKGYDAALRDVQRTVHALKDKPEV